MANLTIKISDSHIPRIKDALGIPESTNTEAKEALQNEIIDFIKGRVRVHERNKAEEAARLEAEKITDIEVTL